MIESAVADCSPRSSDSESSTIILSSRSVPKLSSLIYQLVKGRIDVIGELNLSNRSLS